MVHMNASSRKAMNSGNQAVGPASRAGLDSRSSAYEVPLGSRYLLSGIAIVLLLAAFAQAGVGDPTIETDHPIYPGEGAFQTIEQCVAHATKGKTTPQEKAIALYLWLLTHQFHLQSPQEWCVPGKQPGAKLDDYDMVVYDANRGRFTYGYGLCGTVHAWNEPYWQALGMNARRRAFPGHTNSEIFYDDGWHAFDTDMAGLVFRHDGVVAGYDDIIKDPTLIDVDRSPLPRYPFAWPSDFNGMKQGWQQIAKGGDWYKMYASGYVAMPAIVHLRKGETFTRYYDPDHFGGPSKRRFWHIQKNGPQRDWTFVNAGEPQHNGAKSNSRGNASYCNGEFMYRPDLSDESCREGIVAVDGPLMISKTSPHLRSRDGTRCRVVFGHYSPYVIGGDPDDDANPMTGKATGGLIVSGKLRGTAGFAGLSVSNHTGLILLEEGRFEIDLTEFVKGRNEWEVGFHLDGPSGLDELTFATVTQVAQTIYPRLKAGGCEVTYRVTSRGVTQQLRPAEVAALRSNNVRPVSGERVAYRVEGNKQGSVAFRLESHARLCEVASAARFLVRSPAPAGCDYRLELSTDEGKSWQPLGKADLPTDNEYSSGWMYGRAEVADNAKAALVRAHLYGGGYQTGLISAELYGIYRTPPPQGAKITYSWMEDGQVKQHAEQVAAGAAEHRFRVPTGDKIVDEFVRIEVP